MDIDCVISKTDEYLKIPAIVSHEKHFFDYLQQDLNFPGYSIDRSKGLIAVKSKRPSDRILTAHIDRHGIITNHSGNFELACSHSKKNYGAEVKYSRKLFNEFGQRISNEPVIAYNSAGKEIARGFTTDYCLDYDSKSLTYSIDGFDELPSGATIAFDSTLAVNGDFIDSQIDNVICVGIIHELIRQGFDGHMLLTAEEEIGRSWRYIVDYLEKEEIETDSLITLDTSPFKIDDPLREGRIVLRNRDSRGNFNPRITSYFKEICRDNLIPFLVKDEEVDHYNAKLPEEAKKKKVGNTELGSIITGSKGRYTGTTLQLPTTGYHTNHETTSKTALENLCELFQHL